MSKMLNEILKLTALNRHNDGSHEVKSIELEGVTNTIHNLWVDASNQLAAEQELNKRLRDALEAIEAVSCGETQIESDGVYDDGDGLQWIYKRCQALKGE